MRSFKQLLQERKEHKQIERLLSEDNHEFY